MVGDSRAAAGGIGDWTPKLVNLAFQDAMPVVAVAVAAEVPRTVAASNASDQLIAAS